MSLKLCFGSYHICIQISLKVGVKLDLPTFPHLLLLTHGFFVNFQPFQQQTNPKQIKHVKLQIGRVSLQQSGERIYY